MCVVRGLHDAGHADVLTGCDELNLRSIISWRV